MNVSLAYSRSLSRRFVLRALAAIPTLPTLPALLGSTSARADDTTLLASWNDGPAKQAILDFIRSTTDASSKTFVPMEERIATFDQDGTLWVEHPIYSQLVYCLDRVPVVVKGKPTLAHLEPFRTVLTGDFEKIARLSLHDFETIAIATLTGMSVDDFAAEAKAWIDTAKDHRWKRLYTELTYQPMQEVLTLFRANGYKTFIVTGGGQDFVRVYSQQVYGIPPEQVVGSAIWPKLAYDKNGKPFLTKEPKLLLNDDNAGKVEDIHLMIGRRPHAAFGNSLGDRQMLEYTKAGDGARLSMIVLHDDAQREYAYGPAQGLPATKVGTFPQALYDEAKKDGWFVISMKDDWKRIFAFEG
jgi:phosphoglycolate phosphatase-like HAD superfamily hydrolase